MPSRRWQARAQLGLKAAVIGYALFDIVTGTLEASKKYGRGAPQGPLGGAYEVTAFVRRGEVVPPLLTDERRWQRVFIHPTFARVQMMDQTLKTFRCQIDGAAETLTLTDTGAGASESKTPAAVLHVTHPDAESLALQGTVDGEPVEMRAKTIDTNELPLVTRGFHWVQERPYNR